MIIDSDYIMYLALSIGLIGGIIYLKDTISGRVKPNKVTYFLWFLLPVIGFAAELDEGVGFVAYYTLLIALITLCVFLASFLNKDAYWKLGRFDYVMGGLALIGIILWQLTGEGNLAIALVIFADSLASLPTIRKSYIDPTSERSIPYALAGIAAGLTLLAVPIWNFAHYGFPLYCLIVDGSIVAAIIISNKKKKAALPATPQKQP